MKRGLPVLGFLVTACLVGFFIGRARSVDSDDPRTAKIYLALYGTWSRVDSAHGRLTMHAGDTYYSYTTGADEVTTSIDSALDLASRSMPHVDLTRDGDKLISLTGPAAGILATVIDKEALTSFRSLKKGELALLAGLTIGVGWLGYRLGHTTDINYDSQAFRSTLRDVALWKSIEVHWRAAYRKYLDKEQFQLGAFPLGQCDSYGSKWDKYLCRLDAVHPEIRSEAIRFWEDEHPRLARLDPNALRSLLDSWKRKDPKVTIDGLLLEHNALNSGRRGMLIHARIAIDNLEGERLTAIAYVRDALTDEVLVNPNAECHSTHGELCAQKVFTPQSTGFNEDVPLFLPYDDFPNKQLPTVMLKYHVYVRRVGVDGELAKSSWHTFTFWQTNGN